MFSFQLKDLPFAVLRLVSMPICWMQKGFEKLSVNHQAKVMWDALYRAGHEIEDLQGTIARLEKELTAWNVFAPIFNRTIEDFAKFKSDRECEKEYPFGYPETPEAAKKRHERAINHMMRGHIRDGYFVSLDIPLVPSLRRMFFAAPKRIFVRWCLRSNPMPPRCMGRWRSVSSPLSVLSSVNFRIELPRKLATLEGDRMDLPSPARERDGTWVQPWKIQSLVSAVL